MKLAHFYESVGTLDPAEAGMEAADSPRRTQLAKTIVNDLLDEYARLMRYEKQYLPNLADERGDARSLAVLHSFWQLFEAWVNEAEPIYARVKDLPALRLAIPNIDELRDAIVFARLRLRVTPEQELESARRCRRGECIRTTVQELRNELRARRRA
jgi:hypothetical protein